MVLTEHNYYGKEANECFFSVSQYKDFMKCEAMAMAKIHGEYERPVTRRCWSARLWTPILRGRCRSL